MGPGLRESADQLGGSSLVSWWPRASSPQSPSHPEPASSFAGSSRKPPPLCKLENILFCLLGVRPCGKGAGVWQLTSLAMVARTLSWAQGCTCPLSLLTGALDPGGLSSCWAPGSCRCTLTDQLLAEALNRIDLPGRLHHDDAQHSAQQPGLHCGSELSAPRLPGLYREGEPGVVQSPENVVTQTWPPDHSEELGCAEGPSRPRETHSHRSGVGLDSSSWCRQLPGLGIKVDTAAGPIWGPESRRRPPWPPGQHRTTSPLP